MQDALGVAAVEQQVPGVTVGQQRRRRQQRGGTGKHWSTQWINSNMKAEYVRKAGGEVPASRADALADQFQRILTERSGVNPSDQLKDYLAWKSTTGGPISPDRVAKLTQAARAAEEAEVAATPRFKPEPEPQPEAFFTPANPAPGLPPKQLALETPGPPPRPPAGPPPKTPGTVGKARSLKAQRAADVELFLDEFATETGGNSALMLAIEQPGWWAENYEQAAAAAAQQGEPWAGQLGTYLVYILSSGPHAGAMTDAAARVRSQLAEDKPTTSPGCFT